MRVLVEVVADDREDCATLLRDAAADVERFKPTGETVNACIGDYRVTLTEEKVPEPPFAKGDRVRCVNHASAYYRKVGTVQHSGPRMTGVLWDGDERTNIRPNAQLEKAT